jgi:putative addiction module antidote
MPTLKVIQIGDSLGLILPKDVIAKLNLEIGDDVQVLDCPNGILITTNPAGVNEQLKLARVIMEDRRDALHKLSK